MLSLIVGKYVLRRERQLSEIFQRADVRKTLHTCIPQLFSVEGVGLQYRPKPELKFLDLNLTQRITTERLDELI